jgi:hypothetical protein
MKPLRRKMLPNPHLNPELEASGSHEPDAANGGLKPPFPGRGEKEKTRISERSSLILVFFLV